MSAHVLLNFLNELGKKIRFEALPSIYRFSPTRLINSIILEHECKIQVIIWATSRENVSSGIFDQVRFKPACSATEVS